MLGMMCTIIEEEKFDRGSISFPAEPSSQARDKRLAQVLPKKKAVNYAGFISPQTKVIDELTRKGCAMRLA